MKETSWKNFLTFFERTFFTEFTVILTTFFLLYVIIKHYPKKKFAYLFLMYAIACLILFIALPIQMFFFPVEGRLRTVILESANTFFAICELYVFITFFFQIIESKKTKKTFFLLLSAFFISIIVFFATVLDANTGRTEIAKVSIAVNILEFSIFLVAILSYFNELFTKPPTQDLANSPAFWISSGLFIYILISLPMLLFSEYIMMANRSLYYLLFSLHFLSLALLLFTICKAFLCREPLTT